MELGSEVPLVFFVMVKPPEAGAGAPEDPPDMLIPANLLNLFMLVVLFSELPGFLEMETLFGNLFSMEAEFP